MNGSKAIIRVVSEVALKTGKERAGENKYKH